MDSNNSKQACQVKEMNGAATKIGIYDNEDRSDEVPHRENEFEGFMNEFFKGGISPVTEHHPSFSIAAAVSIGATMVNNVPAFASRFAAFDEQAASSQHFFGKSLGPQDKVARVQPYHGELCPPGFLHGAFGFTVMASNDYKRSLSAHAVNPVSIVMNMLTPKLDELRLHRRFCLENFDKRCVSLLGKGSFGEVYKQKFKREYHVALKRFKNSSNPLPIYQEVHTLIKLQHKRVVKLFGAFHERGTFLVMELCLGNLRTFLKVFTRKQKVRFGIQILEGLRFIHSKDILHCDVKPDNIFITAQNNAVLGDFGNSKIFPTGYDFVTINSNQPRLGSPGYSDALANERVYSKASDIFGAGCTLFEIDCGQPLMAYPDRDVPVQEYIKVARHGRLIHYPTRIPGAPIEDLQGERVCLSVRSRQSCMFGLMLKDMVHDAKRRLGADEILIKYHVEFSKLLHAVSSSWDDIDIDSELGQIAVRPTILMEPVIHDECPYDVNVAMDLIYWDSKMNINESDVIKEQPQELPVVKINELETMIMKFIHDRSFRVAQPHDLSLAPSEVASCLQGPLTVNVATAAMMKAQRIAGDRDLVSLSTNEEPTASSKHRVMEQSCPEFQCNVLDNATGLLPTRMISNPNLTNSAPKPSCSANSTRYKESAESSGFGSFSERATANISDKNTSSTRKRSREKHRNLSHDKPSAMEPSDVIKKKHRKKFKRKEVKDLKHDRSGSTEKIAKVNESSEKINAGKSTAVSNSVKKVKNKEWYLKNKQRIPSRLRGKPPDPINLPPNFTARKRWNGWFECEEGCSYYTHDYKACGEHISACSDRLF